MEKLELFGTLERSSASFVFKLEIHGSTGLSKNTAIKQAIGIHNLKWWLLLFVIRLKHLLLARRFLAEIQAF